ncbi:hypothetical protein BKD26_05905 [Streptomyces sp. CB03238]|nr:hypothetical protein BKD26_05905 [Streptomyces sp. CB03238]
MSAHTGMSLASVVGARRHANRAARTFDVALARARAEWRDVLGRVAVDGGTDAERTILGCDPDTLRTRHGMILF